ncbi:phage antirepressor KilAC domain-containing protein [Acinetobacter sp. VNK23]|uniref:phage antirepressor KilAC domain-containing protein n=1 Tax=Acinetobacter thutiue TaxID=2998078 RepID=UPI0025767515|nr:phage antirepressor KilAC domain-containing protein [Acinetobacter thutiue]MDM1021643.1 phage antirepressor KilAC domain-containing protein [Acinetobacter thutiue]
MNNPALVQSSANQVSSLDLLKIINDVRQNFGEPVIRPNDFHARVANELEGEHYETFTVTNPNNTVTYAALLSHDQCILVAMRESRGVRRNVLEKLKSQQAYIPQTYAEALQLAANQARQLELAAPKVEYYDKIVERSTLLNASQVAQKIKISAVKMNQLLDNFDVYHRGIKRARLFQQWFIDKGFGEVKQTELGFSQPMFTTKGEAWVIEKLTAEGLV